MRRRLLLGERATATLHALHLETGTAAGPVSRMPPAPAAQAAAALRGAWPGGGAAALPSEDPLAGWTARVPFAPMGATVHGRIVQASWKTKELLLAAAGTEVFDPGPHAAAPQCTHFGTCGGCSFQSTSYVAQVQAKEAFVEAAFERECGTAAWRAVRPALARYPLPPQPPYRYRNRAAFSLGAGCDEWMPQLGDGAAAASPRASIVLGFHPSRHVMGGGGGARRRHRAGGGGPTVACDGAGPLDASGGSSPTASCVSSTAAPRGPWSRVVHVDSCALMPTGTERVLSAVRGAAEAWGADPQSRALPPLPDSIDEVVVRVGDAPIAADGQPAPRPTGRAFQVVIKWALQTHLEAFTPWLHGFLLPRLALLEHVTGVVGVSYPTTVPRLLRAQWAREERGALQAARSSADAEAGATSQHLEAPAQEDALVTAAVSRRAVAHLAGASVVYAGCERLLKRYRLPAAGATLDLHVSPRAFVQPSDSGAEAIFAAVTHAAEHAWSLSEIPGQPRVVWDLFCGTGALGLALLRQQLADSIVGLEVDASAVEDARRNASINSVSATRAHFATVDLEMGVANLGHLVSPTMVILDPPRAGVHARLLEQLMLRVRPSFILYVSCNPATQARDVNMLCGAATAGDDAAEGVHPPARFRVRSLTTIDQYAQTSHIESVVLLQRE